MNLDYVSIAGKIGQLWPGSLVSCGNSKYLCPSLKEIKELLGASYLEKYPYVRDVTDCDSFARILDGYVVQECWRQKWPRMWAAGQVRGLIQGVSHAQNFVIADDGEFYFIEPQNDSVRPADLGGDHPWFFWM